MVLNIVRARARMSVFVCVIACKQTSEDFQALHETISKSRCKSIHEKFWL
jgi:hypothetical protein